MNNDERDQLIMEKLNSGMSLSDLQKLLNSEYGISMTYFDLRLLTTTLKIQWEKQDKPKKPALAPQPQKKQIDPLPEEEPVNASPQDTDASEDTEETGETDDDAEDGEFDESEGTVVTIDDTPIQGASISGTVKFASSASGKWMMDRQGHLGIYELDKDSEQPSQDDIQLFQIELQKLMQEKSAQLHKKAFDGKTIVEISPLVKPGCEMNGSVTFASGVKGEWMFAGGKLDFNLDDPNAKPTRDDLAYFQIVLTQKLKEKGYGA